MLKIIKKLFPILICWGIFIFVIFNIPYPQSLIQADKIQLFLFFIPLFLALTFTINIFLNNLFVSASTSLGLVTLLILKALDILNLVTSTFTLIASGLLVSYFRKTKSKSLTNHSKIPKLTHLRRKK